MTLQALPDQRTLLRIFVTEGDRVQRRPLHQVILEKARELKIAGCTVLRGFLGFGASGSVHSDFPPDYAVDLPVVLEITDTEEKTDALLRAVEPLLAGTLVTEEKIHVREARP